MPLALIATMCLTTACETQRVIERSALVAPTSAWPERRAALQALRTFALAGRIAVAAGDQGFSGAMRFDQRLGEGELELDGPLGVGGLRLTWNGESLAVLTSRGEALDGEAARAELERRLGFALPLDRMRYWLLGVPAPAVPADEILAADNRLTSLRQDDWQISYAQYSPVSGLPERMTVQRENARVRLVLDRWQQ
jgi:outer membrane lipoprotein LolB